MDSKQILSVGIDIGTSTSQLVFSRLELRNRAAACQIPRFEITDRRIVWQSPVAFTPLTDVDTLDEAALDALIRGWYAEAGVRPEDVETGAVIVTGESLKTVNARRTVMRLADSLGDFVVASAGPHLESVIAGRGAGAAALSEARRGTVLNIDIGGGTSNYAVFRAGRVIDTACLNMGGRLAETDGHGWITRVRKPLLPVLEELYGSRAPETLGPDDIPAIADRMAGLIWQVLADERSPLADRLLQTPPLKTWRYDAVTLSGGVGACCAEPEADPFRFRDLGPSLARAIVRHPGFAALPLLPPSQTVRATVIGAGSWMLSLSGATVWADDALLPMRNLPVVFPWLDWHAGLTPAAVETAIGDAMRRMDLGDADRFVVGLPAGMPVAYATVCLLVEALAGFWSRRPEGQPALVALAEDMGKVLGMELRPRLNGRPLVVLDELKLADGDYLDMGTFSGNNFILSVTAFSQNNRLQKAVILNRFGKFSDAFPGKNLARLIAIGNDQRNGDFFNAVPVIFWRFDAFLIIIIALKKRKWHTNRSFTLCSRLFKRHLCWRPGLSGIFFRTSSHFFDLH